MNEITNKHLFVTMILIAIITIGVIVAHGNTNSYAYPQTAYTVSGNSLGANVYDAYNVDYSGSRVNLNTRQNRYVPVIYTSYPATTAHYVYDATPSYTTQNSTSYTYEDDSGYGTNYNYSTPTNSYMNNYNGYQDGCAPGYNFSVTTGQYCQQ